MENIILSKKEELGEKGKIKVYLGDTPSKIKEIKEILNQYQKYLDNKTKNENFLGLDFEFNSKKVALAQLYLENYPDKNQDYVLVFDPKDLEQEFRETLLHPNLQVILHGSESLDLPYLYFELIKNPKDIVRFTRKFIDTKYLCEYTLLSKEGRCKIYYLLLQEKVITKKKFNDLIKNEEKMGKIYLITIDVKNLSKEVLLYSVYDVIYLPNLVRKLKTRTPFQEINRFTQVSFLYRNNLLPEFNRAKEIITNINNSYFKNISPPDNKLIDYVSEWITLFQNKKLENYKKISGFKKLIELIERTYLYPVLIKLNSKLNLNLVLINQEKLEPLDLPDEIKHYFIDLQNKVKILFNP